MFRSVSAHAVACLLFSVCAVGCGDDSPTAPVYVPQVRSITASPSQLTLRIDESAVLVADVVADSGANTGVIWQSADQRRVGVTATGIVLGISAGTAVVTATSVADSTKKAYVNVTVLPGYGVKSITVSPTNVVLDQGATQPLAVAVDAEPGVSRAVTFTSSAPSVATVTTMGLVTAVGAGAALIRVTSVLDTTIAVTVGVTVRERQPAVVSIQSITTGSSNTPVNILNIAGQIEVTVQLNTGDETVSRVEVMLNNGTRDTVMAVQSFSGAEQAAMRQAQAEAAFAAAIGSGDVAAAAVQLSFTLSVNTAAFNPSNGAVAVRNGPHAVRAAAVITGTPGVARRSSTGANLLMNNIDGFFVALSPLPSTSIPSARDINGIEWIQAGNGLRVTTLPVMYSGLAVGRRTISFPGNAPVATIQSSKPGVSTDTLLLPAYNSPATGAAYTAGELPSVAAADGQGNPITLVLAATGDGAGIINVSPATPVASRLRGVRVDNAPPPAGATFTVSSALANTNNWVGANYDFLTGVTGVTPDGGVGLTSNTSTVTPATVGAKVIVTGGGLIAPTAVTRGGDLPASNVNSAYTAELQYADRLGNVRAVPMAGTTANPLTTFGVDVAPPTIRYLTTAPSGTAGAALSTGTEIFAASTVNGNPLVFGVEAIDDRSGLGPMPAYVTLQRFSQPNPAGTFDGTVTCVIGTVTNGLCTPIPVALGGALLDNFRQVTTFVDGGSGQDGYYIYTAFVRDQAGNQSGTRIKRVLIDAGTGPSAPAISGMGIPPILFGGQPAAFLPTAVDNVELARGILYITYPMLPVTTAIAYDGTSAQGFPIGTAFDNELRSPIQGGFGFTIQKFIRGIEITDGSDAPQPYPGANAKPDGVNAAVFDFSPGAPGASLPANVAILAQNVDGPGANPGFAARTGANALAKWRRSAAGTNPLRFEAVGPSGQTVSPFALVVLLQLVPGHGPNAQAWRIAGELTASTSFDNGLNRIWTYDFGSRSSGSYIALGISAAGDAIASQPAVF